MNSCTCHCSLLIFLEKARPLSGHLSLPRHLKQLAEALPWGFFSTVFFNASYSNSSPNFQVDQFIISSL